MSKRFDELKSFIEETEADFDKFYNKGNKAAGTRVRKAMRELKTLAQEIRVEIQERKQWDWPSDTQDTRPPRED